MKDQLLDAVRKFDRRGLVRVYEQHSPGLFRYAYRLLGARDLSEDCVAETFRRFLHALKDGRGPDDQIQAYLYRIAHNWITDHYRRQPPPEEPLEFARVSDREANPAQIVSQRLDQVRVREALAHLTQEQQIVIALKFYEGWTYEEVASLLDKSVEATRALQYRALKALRRHLIEES